MTTTETVEAPTTAEGQEKRELESITITFKDGGVKTVVPEDGDTIIYVAFTRNNESSETEALFGVVGENPLEVVAAGSILLGATDWPKQTLAISSQLMNTARAVEMSETEETEGSD